MNRRPPLRATPSQMPAAYHSYLLSLPSTPLVLSAMSLELLSAACSRLQSHRRAVLRLGRAWSRTKRWSEPWVRTLTALAREQQALARAKEEWEELYALCAPLVRPHAPAGVEW